jgi:hypothetical protein
VSRNWTFISNYFDKTLLRNYAAYYVASLLEPYHENLYFAPTHILLDVYIDGIYQGVYLMSDQVNRMESGRAELNRSNTPERSDFMIERDERVSDRAENLIIVDGVRYGVRFPRNERLTAEHLAYAKTYITDMERAMQSGDYERIKEYVDIPSFIDFFLIQELFKNQDVAFASTFFQIKGRDEKRRLYMGPIWDFDLGAGNAYYADRNRGGYSPSGMWVDQHNWFRYLWAVDAFRADYIARFNEIKDNEIAQMIRQIDYISKLYETTFLRNFDRWRILNMYVWPNPDSQWRNHRTFQSQVEYLVDWLERRVVWMDEFYN